jgi:class 3 adenylate cyclase
LLCLLGQSSTPHVKFQAEVAGHSSVRFPLNLQAGSYRFRTVEAGASADVEIRSDDLIPAMTIRDAEIVVSPAPTRQEIAIRNETRHPLFVVVEDRTWTKDALTGERVIAMGAFRRLCPEQLLRPGDDVEIGSIAIMFTDLKGSTQLYEQLGDARAYHLVRDHFAFLSERIERHHGVIVKTVGDAVMAAFHDPSDAVRAALAIQDEVAAFNSGRGDASIVLKLGLHAGPCICVTTADVLDYFGSMVNTASRLEHECGGGEVVISETVMADEGIAQLIAERGTVRDIAALRGVSEPFRFRRVRGCGDNAPNQPDAATATGQPQEQSMIR